MSAGNEGLRYPLGRADGRLRTAVADHSVLVPTEQRHVILDHSPESRIERLGETVLGQEEHEGFHR